MQYVQLAQNFIKKCLICLLDCMHQTFGDFARYRGGRGGRGRGGRSRGGYYGRGYGYGGRGRGRTIPSRAI